MCILSNLPEATLSDLVKLMPNMNDKINSVSAIKGINNPGAIIGQFNKLRIIFEFQHNEAKNWFINECNNEIKINAKHECIRIRTIRDDMLKMKAIYPDFISVVQKFALHMKAKNVSQFGSYSQFIEAYLNYARKTIEKTKANEFNEYNKQNKQKMSLKNWSGI